MKISNKFPRFSEKTLIIVCNPREAIFYYAEGDNLEKIAEFKLDKIVYSDREDFGRLSTGGVYETGAKYEKQKVSLRNDFKAKFVEVAKSVSKKINFKKLHVVSAVNIHRILLKILPKNWLKILGAHFKGDYTKKHPFEILQLIRNGSQFAV